MAHHAKPGLRRHLHYDDVIKWKHFPRYWPFERGIHLSPVNLPHKGQWHGALVFLWSAPEPWTNTCTNNRDACNLRRHCAHYDVFVILQWNNCLCILWPYSQSALPLFVCIPNLGSGSFWYVQLPVKWQRKNYCVIPKITGYLYPCVQSQNILTRFIPNMKSGSHIYMSKVLKGSSLPLLIDPCRAGFILTHYGDVIMGLIASQITSLTVVCSTVYSDADQR